MKIFHSINDFQIASGENAKKTILTLGTFDGVHFGHKKILEKVTQNTENEKYESLVLTFFPHPRMVLQEDSDIKLLNTIEEKIELLDKIGIQNLVIHPFDESFSRLTAEEFVKNILVDKFHIYKIIIGHDHRFGRNRTANINDLKAFGAQYDFEVEEISAQEIKEVSVSSTKIRHALSEGNMALANEYLGYNYSLTGIIAKGKQLGRTIGFPTANLKIAETFKLIPKNGVYIVKSIIQTKTVLGMMNIGFNPTVDGKHQTIEINYFDFDEDLYDQKITVSILERIRSEVKFDSVALLKEQLEKDKETALAYFKSKL
ncbi:bifunctional riboflavin kinase/FAD synthetase [Flavobacterium gilvum]|uniref:Riboflavin biosynthesis protein n=1 Tax=Flavobacterium gilvum TaxID=1492737 RepID=A0AAC9I1T2_9FLAO|nr:bifunctional riboflavin kinase/FAD synthetase [Flavobacterium gilvum]AOW08934.1 riboflavin biosynthesis protein RibF [Flavobacterium gilvum]KFC60914.1 riboflavin biosynthesis protein RibF [Flavobacterium gilvum]